MSYDYVIDSYAWIEYFRGTTPGRKARAYIEGVSATTSVLSLAELHEKYLREKWSSFDEDVAFIMTRTSLTEINRQIAVLAGEINHRRKSLVKDWGMADSITLATARIASAKVVTGDRHFKGLDDAILL
jgi:predicted nucleic acid-binding protein